jgi:hypothetical protein
LSHSTSPFLWLVFFKIGSWELFALGCLNQVPPDLSSRVDRITWRWAFDLMDILPNLYLLTIFYIIEDILVTSFHANCILSLCYTTSCFKRTEFPSTFKYAETAY